LMTWKLPFVPWLRTQIDHVWTRWDVSVVIDPLWLSGSDHKAMEIGVSY
jgi:hypothetical protein